MTNEELKLDGEARILIANGEWAKTQWLSTIYGWYNHESQADALESAERHRKIRPKPEPKRRKWNKPEDVPGPVCWIRSKNQKLAWEAMIIMINHCRISAAMLSASGLISLDYSELENYEHSTDRNTWHPCETEDAE